jgi:hypothetical protein
MKNLVRNMLTILMFCLVINGCATKVPCPEPVIEIIKVYSYIECPVKNKPIYGEFNNGLHAGHLGNLEMMKFNLEKALRYNDSLEITLDCYKKQAEKVNETQVLSD